MGTTDGVPSTFLGAEDSEGVARKATESQQRGRTDLFNVGSSRYFNYVA